VFDDVERGRFLVEPAGEDALDLPLGVADVELEEGAGQRLHFPRRGRLAGAKADDHVAGPYRLPRLQREFAGNAVALVEQADDRHPIGHRRGSGRERGDGLRHVDGLRLGFVLGIAGAPRAALFTSARREREQGGTGARQRPPHAWSGVQAS
jgi:hypothetical protein